MIERIRQSFASPAPWIAIAALMVSGTVALVGFWVTFSGYDREATARLVTLEVTVRSNSAWRTEQEKGHQDLIDRIAKLEGEMEAIERQRSSP